MFDIGASELLVIVIVAILVIGPKDLPLALRTAGRWIGKVRRVSSHFRTGVDTMIREAELEDMEKKWKAQNDAIMARGDEGAISNEMTGPPASTTDEATAETEDANAESKAGKKPIPNSDGEPQLPLGKPDEGR
jgi:sec-independent protein translocase protein TatB